MNETVSSPVNAPKAEISKNSFLFKTLIVYFCGTFISKLVSFFLLPFITNTISTSDYGDFDLVSAIVLVLTPVFSLQITEALYRFLFKAKPDKERTIIADAFVVMGLGMALCGLGFLIVNEFIYRIPYCWLTYAYFCATLLLDGFQKIARSKNRAIPFAVSGVTNTVVMVATQAIAILAFKAGVVGLLLGYIAGCVSGALFLFFKLALFKNMNPKHFSKTTLREMLRYCVPLIPNNISWWIANLLNKFIVIFFLGSSAQGIYAITGKFTAILLLFTDVFKMSWAETSISFYTDPAGFKAYNSGVFDRFIKLLFSGCSFVIPLIYLIFPFFIGQEYQEGLQYIPLALYASCFSSVVSFYGAGYGAAKRTKGAFFTSLIGMALNVGLCFLLIRWIGLFAMPVAALFAYLTLWIIRAISMRSFYPIRVNAWTLVLLAVLISSTCTVFYLGGFWGNLISAVALFAAFVFVNRSFVKGVWLQAKNKAWPIALNLFKRLWAYLKSPNSFFFYLFLSLIPLVFFVSFLSVFSGSIPGGVIDSILVLLLVLPAFTVLFSKRVSVVDLSVLGYCVYSFCNIWVLNFRGMPVSVGIHEYASSVIPVSLYFVAKKYSGKKTNNLVGIVVLCSILISFMAGVIWNIFLPDYYLDYTARINFLFNPLTFLSNIRMQSFLGSTMVGLTMGMLAFLSVVFLLLRKKLIYVITFIIACIGAYLSGQRVSFVIIFFAVATGLIAVFLKIRKMRFVILTVLGLTVLGITGACLLSGSFRSVFFNSISKIFSAFSDRTIDYVAPFTYREYLLFGKGTGAFSHYAFTYTDYVVSDCAFTKTICEEGIVGSLLFFFPIVAALMTFFRSRNKDRMMVPFGMMACSLICGVGSNSFCFETGAILLWVSVGLIEGYDSRFLVLSNSRAACAIISPEMEIGTTNISV